MKCFIALTLVAGPAFAETCPAVTDHSARQAEIFNQLQALPTQDGSRELSQELWYLWTDAPDAQAQTLLDEGMRKREGYDFLGARDVLDQLVEYCPDYAEGYNQRAFASFLRQDYAAALYDLDAALALMPTHVAALSGKALTLIGMGRDKEAQIVLRAAHALNPWLSERRLLVEPEGEEI
jgi:tetratricopeptide (TPR) repeat protein